MSVVELLAGRLGYLVAALLVALGLFVVVDDDNLVKKVVGLNVFQTGVLLLFLLVGYRRGGGFPVGTTGSGAETAVNPLPQALVLTAIVVGVCLSALALALVVRIHGAYGTVSESELREVVGRE